MEAVLSSVLARPFQISTVPDSRYGEAVVMLVEGELPAPEEQMIADFHKVLDAYFCPKHVFSVPALPRTGSGKPDRASARQLAREMMEARHG